LGRNRPRASARNQEPVSPSSEAPPGRCRRRPTIARGRAPRTGTAAGSRDTTRTSCSEQSRPSKELGDSTRGRAGWPEVADGRPTAGPVVPTGSRRSPPSRIGGGDRSPGRGRRVTRSRPGPRSLTRGRPRRTGRPGALRSSCGPAPEERDLGRVEQCLHRARAGIEDSAQREPDRLGRRGLRSDECEARAARVEAECRRPVHHAHRPVNHGSHR
jgi:hypothetical protein